VSELVELGVLRLCFLGSFIALAWAALTAFGVAVPIGDLIVSVCAVTLISTIPVSVAGLGTSQVAFVYFFRHWADDETLLACSLALSGGLITLRAAIGIVFAREFTREALAAQEAADCDEAGALATADCDEPGALATADCDEAGALATVEATD